MIQVSLTYFVLSVIMAPCMELSAVPDIILILVQHLNRNINVRMDLYTTTLLPKKNVLSVPRVVPGVCG